MKSVSTKLLATICASMLLTACATTRSPLTPQQVTTLLTTMPAETTNDRDATAKQFLRGGEAAIVDLFHKVVPTGDGDDTAVRTALNGIAKYASRPGAEKQRKTFENAALTALPTLASDEAKAFTIRQLEVAGGDASVTVLADLLRDAALAQPSITVLQIIATPKAKASIHSALGNTDSAKINAALIKALGELRNDTSNQKIPHRTIETSDMLHSTRWPISPTHRPKRSWNPQSDRARATIRLRQNHCSPSINGDARSNRIEHRSIQQQNAETNPEQGFVGCKRL
ncbi:MAG TPA: hypothetical protein EYN96_05745 [Candidatus Hydrogenedentes bacterium]|nr:hypothetical protein [Candidatus Hydrogenedentota bacterium]